MLIYLIYFLLNFMKKKYSIKYIYKWDSITKAFVIFDKYNKVVSFGKRTKGLTKKKIYEMFKNKIKIRNKNRDLIKKSEIDMSKEKNLTPISKKNKVLIRRVKKIREGDIFQLQATLTLDNGEERFIRSNSFIYSSIKDYAIARTQISRHVVTNDYHNIKMELYPIVYQYK